MSDDLKGLLDRAVVGATPPEPDVDSVRTAGKRSVNRRRGASAGLGLVVVAALALVAFNTSSSPPREVSDPPILPPPRSPSPEPSPGTWSNSRVAERIELPARPASVSVTGEAVWVGLANGTLLRIDPLTNRIVDTIDVGSTIVEVEATENTVWVAGTPDGKSVDQGFGGPQVDTIFKVDIDSDVAVHVSTAVEMTFPSNVRMTADDQMVFFLAKTNGTNVGSVTRYDIETGDVSKLGTFAGSLILDDGTLWLGGTNRIKKVDASSGRVLFSVSAQRRGSDSIVACMDCPPPPDGVAVGPEYVADIEVGGLMTVVSHSGRLIHQKQARAGLSASVVTDGNTLFILQNRSRLAVVDFATGELKRVVENVSPYGQMDVGAGSVWVLNAERKALVRVSDATE